MTPQEKARKLRPIIELAAQSLDDKDALAGIEMFAEWQPDTHYYVGDKRRCGDKLYRVRQEHDSQAQYPPSIDTAALYEEIVADEKQGTRDNPIPYDNNMALEKDKYYSQDGVVYLCIRSTGIPVYNPLADMVGIYVEVV